MKILIASDHAGYERKEEIKKLFPELQWEDLGPHSLDSVDYPDFAHAVGQAIEKVERENLSSKIEDSLQGSAIGFLICSSGQGMAMTANKHPGVRAALCYQAELAALSREHNNANILCLSARFTSIDETCKIINAFLGTAFSGGRHLRRVEKMG